MSSSRTRFSLLLVTLLPALAIHMALLYPIEEHSYDAATLYMYRGFVFSSAQVEEILCPHGVQAATALTDEWS